MQNYTKNYFKYVLGFIFCFLLRLIPFRPPNIEPLLATQMPFAKTYGKLAGFMFGFLSIILYDIITAKVGIWTLITATVYGILGLFATMYFKNKKNKAWNYAKFAIFATIFYDAITGLTIGPLFFHQSFTASLAGQIPFTILHLTGNICFAVVFSPLIYKYIIENQKLPARNRLSEAMAGGEVPNIIKILNPKQI
ncbi:MAG: ECF transporter S component [Candidatus Nomurabacteria bacterium]|nr:ECF transporter S component [Candidatus Nomurabacteria bacterium]